MRRLKRRFVRVSSLGLVIAALAATGCQEPRSYAVRWRVAERTGVDQPATIEPQDEEMTNPSVCTRAGVSQVEVWVLDEDSLGNIVADHFVRPCFPERFRQPGGAVRGATLSPGDYTIIVAGTRANDLPWGECIESTGEDAEPCSTASVETFLAAALAEGVDLCDDGTCAVGLDTCDCQHFTVVADKLERLPDFTLDPPPECEDGIDGDEDGLVDQLDPGCQFGSGESSPILSPEISLSLSVLSGNPNANCDNIGVGALSLTIDGNAIDPVLCNVGTTRFSAPLATGTHELEVAGFRGLDATVDPLTVTKTMTFEVDELGVTTPSVLSIDFADVDLLEPLESTVQFRYQLQMPESEDEQSEPGDALLCSDAAVGATDFRARLLNITGDEVSPTPTAIIPLDGGSAECTVSEIDTLEVLPWGAYLLEIEAYTADGELCWSNADNPEPLVPREAISVIVPPIEDAPAGCVIGE